MYLKAQDSMASYEQIAFNFFTHEIIEKNHRNLKYVLFDCRLEKESPIGYSYCLHVLSNKASFPDSTINFIDIPNNLVIIKNISFFKKLVTPQKKLARLYVFRHFLYDEKAIVVVYLSTKTTTEYFYSIILDQESRKVLDFCVQKLYE